MQRTTDTFRQIDKHGAGKDGFTEGDPGVTAPTNVRAADMDGYQEEILNAVEAAGLAPDASDLGQLLRVLNAWHNNLTLSNFEVIDPSGGVALSGAAYGADLWVVVGNSAEIMTSPEGRVWTARTAGGGYTGNLSRVAFGNSLFVAVGASGGIQTSPDGITWTQRTAAAAYANTFISVEWVSYLSLWVIVGFAGEIQTSPDGITWTHRTQAGAYAGDFRGVANNGALVTIVGSVGEIQTSPDGITWTHRTPAASYAGIFVGAAWGLGVFVAVGNTTAAIQTSPDGITWTDRTQPAGSTFRNVRFARNVFVANTVTTIPHFIGVSHNGTDWVIFKATDQSLATFADAAHDGYGWLMAGAMSGASHVARGHRFPAVDTF